MSKGKRRRPVRRKNWLKIGIILAAIPILVAVGIVLKPFVIEPWLEKRADPGIENVSSEQPLGYVYDKLGNNNIMLTEYNPPDDFDYDNWDASWTIPDTVDGYNVVALRDICRVRLMSDRDRVEDFFLGIWSASLSRIGNDYRSLCFRGSPTLGSVEILILSQKSVTMPSQACRY